MLFSFFSMLASLISPLITLLIGYQLTQVEELLDLFNALPRDKPVTPNKKKTIKLIKLIGMIMVVVGSLRLLDSIIDFFRYFINLIGSIF